MSEYEVKFKFSQFLYPSPQQNLNDKSEFLSSGVLLLRGSDSRSNEHILSSILRCTLFLGLHFNISVVGIHLATDRCCDLIRRFLFSFLNAYKLMGCLTNDGILDQMKYSIFYLHLWAITHKSTSVKWGETIWLKKEICV